MLSDQLYIVDSNQINLVHSQIPKEMHTAHPMVKSHSSIWESIKEDLIRRGFGSENVAELIFSCRKRATNSYFHYIDNGNRSSISSLVRLLKISC